jgi:DNA processing protein
MLSGIGPATLRKATQVFGFEDKSVDQLGSEVPAIGRASAPAGAWSKALELAEEQVDLAERCGARILSPLDAEYPKLLAATKDDPFLLYVRGDLAPSPEKSVAIIGTREPTPHGEIIATRITQFFVEQGWSVVSGLALGCDAIAHRAAIDAGGHTVAVLAHGLQTIAPAKHRG